MQIDFFEEFPNDDSLSKLRIIKFRTNLYVAAKSVKEFLVLKTKIKKFYRNVAEVIYWPILEVNEGYWLSAFSKTLAIKRILNELKNTNEKFSVLWDAELPILAKELFVTQLPNFLRNRKIIKKVTLHQDSNHPLIITAFPKSGINKFFSSLACTYFSSGSFPYIDMLYTSLLRVKDKSRYVRSAIKRNKNKFQEYSVALGLIGRGVEDYSTPLISPLGLKMDLGIAQKEGVKNVVLYRLGGLNKNYLGVLEEFVSK
ncbi:hypothetical protein A2V56_00435 [Candidatus Woesebacteria bacterium RBG_19FT_COMBO_42_9]|uniref:Uncharacterized protein n=1 Tax=Candidatus Woesebacteria bacterium RBG_16_42_24 TaxID=1802485 RepID=A0A1F7XJE6_9BACT|nr:MAG: hypothetical protein A2V97_00185 [Candidatus Woesebacteria bacterium RBG_16_42_24]OGM17468.1 MAG: hypothetical protein A2V56_00435 [Candidatus Woesebacteria bacterium RBG_19FT_COMBO_42_9]OGM67133.1 MAG: hypothetical protein A2985_02705 [Candidatus Woesebacteria bacterium RIFCSPLOWO2_01_FULL_43_11]